MHGNQRTPVLRASTMTCIKSLDLHQHPEPLEQAVKLIMKLISQYTLYENLLNVPSVITYGSTITDI